MLIILLLLGLGVWQLQRLAWKTALIERVEAGLAAVPVNAPGPQDWERLSFDTAEYRRITVSGRYLPTGDFLVKAVTARGPGFWVLSPFETDDGWRLFINRGFVPDDRQAPEDRPIPLDRQEVTGLLRLTQPGGAFLRDNDPQANRWFSRDTAAMAGAADIAPVAPYFIDVEAEPGRQAGETLPVPGLTIVAFSNRHLGYAFTWFALAAVFALLLVQANRIKNE
ncbi:SURF1 family protein [Peteryoungia desertarenae]|uniref:SURF1-like protein n=2 Tax=Peteryoungia desertarenae TaxID=1813451 RepID=A0ABX6QS27_9HYPH|nr:SURF1 family protein [Peteryoungia desertarenae]